MSFEASHVFFEDSDLRSVQNDIRHDSSYELDDCKAYKCCGVCFDVAFSDLQDDFEGDDTSEENEVQAIGLDVPERQSSVNIIDVEYHSYARYYLKC